MVRRLNRTKFNRVFRALFIGFKPNKENVELLEDAGYVDARNDKINKRRVNINGLLNDLLRDYLMSPAGPLWGKTPNTALKKLKGRLKALHSERMRIRRRIKERSDRNRDDERTLESVADDIERVSLKLRRIIDNEGG